MAQADQSDWEEVGHIGDVNWPEYGGGPVFVDKTGESAPMLEYVEPPSDDQEFGDPEARWTVYRVRLDPEVPTWGDIDSVADSAGQDPKELAAAFTSDDPMQRAWAYETWAGHYGWHEFDQYALTLTCAEMNKRYDADLDCYGDIQTKLEEKVQEMADQSSAQAWSTPGDQLIDDLAGEGYDPESVVSVAEFGDAVAVNGDIETEKTSAGVEAELEKDGYEVTDHGGSIPAQEGYAYAKHVIQAVAREMKLPEGTVTEAAEALDWWQEEIPRSTSGYGSIWAKKVAGGGTEEARRTPARRRR
jgi:hypothetical protein